MANGNNPPRLAPELTFPPPVKLSTKFAHDYDEAEKASLPRLVAQVESGSIDRPYHERRTLSNVSGTSSNDTTLVDETEEQERLSPTQSKEFHADGSHVGTTRLRSPKPFVFQRLASAIGFGKARPQDEKLTVSGDEVFVKEQCYETYPMGFPRLAAFQNQSDSCAVYRRFGLLFCRTLLQLQAEITALEKQLFELDTEDEADELRNYRLCSIDDREEWDPAQRNIRKQITEKLSIYADLLDKDARLRKLGPAQDRNYQNVYNWMSRHRPLEKGEDDFILHKEDFVTPVKKSQQGNGINDFIEAYISRRPQGLIKAMLGFKKKAGQEEEGTYCFSCRRIALVTNIVVICIAISVLLIPVFVLYMANITRLQSSGIVLVFTALFATIISLLTDTKVENVFMSTCAYCAVLVVFLSNVQQVTVAPPSP